MQAAVASCDCPECGAVCRGLFNGCAAVWLEGPGDETMAVVAVAGPGRRGRNRKSARRAAAAAVSATRPRPQPTGPPRMPAAARRPEFTRVVEPEAGLPALRERLDGLRLELQRFGASLPQRSSRVGSR
jgi:hypothetical protein